MCACGLIGTKVGLNRGIYRSEFPHYLLICIVFTHRLLFNESATSELIASTAFDLPATRERAPFV